VTHLPRHITPLGLLYIGYPAEEKSPRTQYNPARVHWQEYKKKQPQGTSVE
jgi:nitroreductase